MCCIGRGKSSDVGFFESIYKSKIGVSLKNGVMQINYKGDALITCISDPLHTSFPDHHTHHTGSPTAVHTKLSGYFNGLYSLIGIVLVQRTRV
jgi:hypothetical protein